MLDDMVDEVRYEMNLLWGQQYSTHYYPTIKKNNNKKKEIVQYKISLNLIMWNLTCWNKMI